MNIAKFDVDLINLDAPLRVHGAARCVETNRQNRRLESRTELLSSPFAYYIMEEAKGLRSRIEYREILKELETRMTNVERDLGLVIDSAKNIQNPL